MIDKLTERLEAINEEIIKLRHDAEEHFKNADIISKPHQRFIFDVSYICSNFERGCRIIKKERT